LSGLLLGVSFIVPFLWPLGILGAALLLHCLSVSKDSWKVKLLGAYLAMFIKFLFVLSAYWTMYPIRWLPLDLGTGELAIIGLYWISVSSYIACSGLALFGLVILFKKIPKPDWLYYFILIPIAWVLSEVFGSFILSLFTLGDGSTPNISFSLGYVGYLLGEHHLLAQIARLGGVYALSLSAILIASIIVYFWPKWQKKEKIIFALVLLICVATTKAHIKFIDESSKTENVALISTSIPAGGLFMRENPKEYQSLQADAMSSALESDASYIVWPEGARYFSHLAAGWGTMVFTFENDAEEVVVVDSSVVNTEKGNVLRAEIVDVANKKNFIADKRYLVPQGEFMPYLYQGLFQVVGLGETATKVAGAISYVVGPEVNQSDFSSNIPGILFCFESTNPNAVRTLIHERGSVPFVVHPVSHSWFHEPVTFWSQLDTSLRVQAIWNQVYIATAGNHSASKLFTPQGEIVKPQSIAKGEYWEVGLVSIPLK